MAARIHFNECVTFVPRSSQRYTDVGLARPKQKNKKKYVHGRATTNHWRNTNHHQQQQQHQHQQPKQPKLKRT